MNCVLNVLFNVLQNDTNHYANTIVLGKVHDRYTSTQLNTTQFEIEDVPF